MNGRGVSRSAVLLLLGFGLLLGLLAMHGLSASPSPVHVAEPVLATHHGLGHHGEPITHGFAAGDGVAGHLTGCESGAVCFALLGGVLLLAFGVPRLLGVLPVPRTSPWNAALWRGPPRSRPPDLYRLSVLRL
ncbi:DUF6153 family protein [Actinomadura kijaniata]|uniref:DUF6153 family protein n=1 Tax=Actinomadura kijaniata TaxID=46161 RepID=UPI00082F1154|nr:DUF6153 family protein [Actinomadura kijaniata]